MGQLLTPDRTMCDFKTDGFQKTMVDAGLSDVPLPEDSEHHLGSQATLGYASTRLRQVNLMNAEVIPQDSMSPQQATLTKDTKTNDTTSIAKKSEQDKGPPKPPQNVMTLSYISPTL